MLLVVLDGPVLRLRRQGVILGAAAAAVKGKVMNKIKLRARALDGNTFVSESPELALVDGWSEGTLPDAAGVLPAGLWGKVPGGDPYLLHINVLTTLPLTGGDIFELQSGPPIQPRARFIPTPNNYQLLLVRPTDRLRLLIAPQPEIKVELLVESIGGVNELGSRLFDWAQAAQAAATPRATSIEITGPAIIPSWTGVFHLAHNSAANDVVSLPPRGMVPLDAIMTFTRRGVGTPTLQTVVGDTFSGGATALAVTKTLHLRNNGYDWSAVGS